MAKLRAEGAQRHPRISALWMCCEWDWWILLQKFKTFTPSSGLITNLFVVNFDMRTLLESDAFHFFLDVFQLRWILPCITPFLCSVLWFSCKLFAAHGAKPPSVGLSSCLPALHCKGRVCTCPSFMQSDGSAETRELEMLQSVLTWKPTTWGWNPQLKVFVSPHSTMGLYYYLCRASLQPALLLSLTFLLLYLTWKHLWLGREQWETAAIHTLPLYVLCTYFTPNLAVLPAREYILLKRKQFYSFKFLSPVCNF